MIRVTVDLVPHGEEDGKKVIGILEIWNNATGTSEKGNYCFRISEESEPNIWLCGKISGFPRLQSQSWHLIYLCLKNILEEKQTQ